MEPCLNQGKPGRWNWSCWEKNIIILSGNMSFDKVGEQMEEKEAEKEQLKKNREKDTDKLWELKVWAGEKRRQEQRMVYKCRNVGRWGVIPEGKLAYLRGKKEQNRRGNQYKNENKKCHIRWRNRDSKVARRNRIMPKYHELLKWRGVTQ